jgi:hypothetical protein
MEEFVGEEHAKVLFVPFPGSWIVSQVATVVSQPSNTAATVQCLVAPLSGLHGSKRLLDRASSFVVEALVK